MRRSAERGSFYGSTSHDLSLTLTLFRVLRDDIVVLPLPVCWAVVMTCLDTLPALYVGDHKSCWINNIRFKNRTLKTQNQPYCIFRCVFITLLISFYYFFEESLWEFYSLFESENVIKLRLLYVFWPLRKAFRPRPPLARLGKPHERSTSRRPRAPRRPLKTAVKMPGRRGKDQLPACLWYWTIPVLETLPRTASLSRLPPGGPEPHIRRRTPSRAPKERQGGVVLLFLRG